MRACLADPGQGAPCTAVDPGRGFVLIKDDDPEKPYAWLLVPATDVTGIEDPAVLAAPVAGFWEIGWGFAAELLPVPPERRALAINSKQGRSQNLLHIHVSCISPALRDALARADVGPAWRGEPSLAVGGQTFDVRTVAALAPSPFLVLRDRPGAAEDMGGQSLAVIGRAGGGFYLVADASEPGVAAETEALLDETCAPNDG
jgi:CDP-diacylglycerol pyrophosphatase